MSIAWATLAFLLVGYGVGRLPVLGRTAKYLETIFLTIMAFLLLVPTVTETLHRVSDGHLFVINVKSPLLLGLQASLFVVLLFDLSTQMIHLRKQAKAAAAGASAFKV